MINPAKTLWKLIRAKPAEQAKTGQNLPAGLETIVVPSVRDRWRGTRVASYNQEIIESVLAAAFNGDLTAQWELFDLMEETTPRLQKALNELKRATISLDWNLQPWAEKGKEATPDATERAAFIERQIWNMRPRPQSDENDFDGTIYDVLDSWGKGIAVLEMDFERKEGGVGIRATHFVQSRYYGYAYTGGDLQLNASEIAFASAESQSVRPMRAGSQWMPFPENKFIIAIAKAKSGHPIGGARLRGLAWWWCAANFGAEWLLNYAQLFGQPIRWATYDPSKKGLLAKLAAMMENIGSAGWAAFPQGTTLELKEAAKSGQDNPQAYLLKLFDDLIDITFLGQTATTQGTPGKLGNETAQEGVRGDTIDALADHAAGALQQMVRALCVLNWGDDELCPWFAPSRSETKDAKMEADRFAVVLAMGVPIGKQFLYESLEIPMPADGEETITGNSQSAPGAFGFPPSAAAYGQPRFAKAAGTRQSGNEVSADIVEAAVADMVGARKQWLAPLADELDRLARLAQNGKISDADLTRFAEAANSRLPELFRELKPQALADSLEAALGTTVVEAVTDDITERPPA